MGYFLLSYRTENNEVRAGFMIGDQVFDLERSAPRLGGIKGVDASSLISVMRQWQDAEPIIESAADAPGAGGMDSDNVKLAAPLQYPGVMYMAGSNYSDHVAEMAARGGTPPPVAKDPFFFLKTVAGTVIGPEEEIHLPSYSEKVDWAAEIALVIGKSAKNLNPDNAMDCVAGYTIVNDLSARDQSRRDDITFVYDWIGQKCFDTAAPTGPWIVPAGQIKDANNLSIKLWVNDTLHQDSNTANLIFGYVDLLCYLTKRVTLQPGDVVATGTPSGVGHGKGEYLADGDRVTIEIENVGRLSNPVVQD
ncbi:MAG: fumarylacetoacetate hydrolase family protein [Rhodospirillales bacterium]|nr:fumarylacetoacetate hydrolase family protein [Rhodospirillales bacterium]